MVAKKHARPSKTGKPAPKKGAPAAPTAPPKFVLSTNPAERKATVEQLAVDAGVQPLLAAAPWKRAPKPAEPAAPASTTEPAEPVKLSAPKGLPRPEAPKIGTSPRRLILLDTNALMMQFQFHVDIEKELNRLLDFGHEIVVARLVLNELDNIAMHGAGKDAHEARMAMELAKTFRVVEPQGEGEGDAGLLRLAEKLNAIVVTNDKILRARLRAKDIPNVYMRNKAFLTVEGHVEGM
ncbi:MAG: type II toxin-antitoxin system VapC family toxin [Thermoplasmatota archaeon]